MNIFQGKYKYIVIFGILSILVDRITKLGVITAKEDFIKNPGIAFSIGESVPGILFFMIVLGFIILIYFAKKLDLSQKPVQVALGLIAGGGVSNLIDRIFYGYVIDFIQIFNVSAFNFADLAIVIGSIVLIWHIWGKEKSIS